MCLRNHISNKKINEFIHINNAIGSVWIVRRAAERGSFGENYGIKINRWGRFGIEIYLSKDRR